MKNHEKCHEICENLWKIVKNYAKISEKQLQILEILRKMGVKLKMPQIFSKFMKNGIKLCKNMWKVARKVLKLLKICEKCCKIVQNQWKSWEIAKIATQSTAYDEIFWLVHSFLKLFTSIISLKHSSILNLIADLQSSGSTLSH